MGLNSVSLAVGNSASSSSCAPAQLSSRSTYSGADTLMGLRTFTPSAQRYSYLGPAVMPGHVCGVHSSLSMP